MRGKVTRRVSNRWPDKTIIGLTGNIATGKSVVRRMLEHLGAFSIDADALAHRAMSPGAPAYGPVVELFGRWVVGPDGQIDRAFGEKTFDDLKIPCAVTAVDIKSGSEVTLSEGKLADAVLATIALPGVFPVQYINGWELVDGGVLNPVPVSVARTLSPDLPVVAVVLNDPMDKPVHKYSIPVPGIIPKTIAERITRISLAQSLDIFLRSVDVNSRAVAHFRLQVDKPDVLIRPQVHHLSILDKVVIENVAQLGEEAVEEVLPQIKRAVSWHARLGRKIFGTN